MPTLNIKLLTVVTGIHYGSLNEWLGFSPLKSSFDSVPLEAVDYNNDSCPKQVTKPSDT